MSAIADRNLLFGILALQLDFITRDQLVEAMNAWVLAKQRALGDILVERGALASDDHALLAPMVERHIAKHGGDPAKSLAVLSSVVSARAALAGVVDAEVQASLQQVPQTGQTPAEGEAPPTVAGEAPPIVGTRHLIERPHAKGGLGEVFVARDQELNRKVALKHIQDKHADDPASRSLFLQEGEITGGLEHPGIIPIYGLGQYADGRPFYAMRFVQGDSLLAAIERFYRPAAPLGAGERNVAFRSLLGRFLDVCNAVAYAHRRGVLHRDLKPGNIMLGEFGETLVIDWGMAKLLKSASGTPAVTENVALGDPLIPSHEALATVGRGAHGTPGYMSPEQAAGRIDDLGPATDIYSLGAILFHILTGRPPLTREDGDIVGRTIRGDLPSVRQLKPDVSRSLEAVCRKALALRPAERFASVQALAADVRQWLADEPVSAWREPLGLRARRWVRKHPRLVAGATAALLVGLLASLGGSALLNAKNRELETTNTQLDEANTELRSINASLDKSNSDLVQILSYVWWQRRSLRMLQGLPRDDLVERINHPMDTEDVGPHGVSSLSRLEVSEFVNSKMGDLLRNRGDWVPEALQRYRESLKIAQSLADAAPRNLEAEIVLAHSHFKIGDAFKEVFGHAEAVEHFEKALAVLRPWQQAGKLEGTRFAHWPGKIENSLRDCKTALKALGNLDALLKLPVEEAVQLLALRAKLLARQDKHVEAASDADKLAGLAQTGEQHFFAAAAFAWCTRDKANEDRHANRALACLAKARDAGFFKDRKNVEELNRGEAFNPLLSREAFKQLLADLATEGK